MSEGWCTGGSECSSETDQSLSASERRASGYRPGTRPGRCQGPDRDKRTRSRFTGASRLFCMTRGRSVQRGHRLARGWDRSLAAEAFAAARPALLLARPGLVPRDGRVSFGRVRPLPVPRGSASVRRSSRWWRARSPRSSRWRRVPRPRPPERPRAGSRPCRGPLRTWPCRLPRRS